MSVRQAASRAMRAAVLLAALPTGLGAAEPAGCAADPAFALLDFWVGDWEVWSGGERAGRDRVRKDLGGCAVFEEWTAADGGRGFGVFYYAPLAKAWKQVWVTDLALRPGGLKEKRLVARFADGGVRFQGEIPLPDGRVVIDRTTLRPRPGGTVGQRIEISRDGGDTWAATFDAEYRPGGR